MPHDRFHFSNILLLTYAVALEVMSHNSPRKYRRAIQMTDAESSTHLEVEVVCAADLYESLGYSWNRHYSSLS